MYNQIANSIIERIKTQQEIKKKLNILQHSMFYFIKSKRYDFIIEFDKLDTNHIYTTKAYNISSKHIIDYMTFNISSITELRYADDNEISYMHTDNICICNLEQNHIYKWISNESGEAYVFMFDSLRDGYIFTKHYYKVSNKQYISYASQLIKISDIKEIKPANISESSCLLSYINPVKRLSKFAIIHNKYTLKFDI